MLGPPDDGYKAIFGAFGTSRWKRIDFFTSVCLDNDTFTVTNLVEETL